MIPYLDVQNLTKSFGAQVLFHDLCFSIGEGQRVGLIKSKTGSMATAIKLSNRLKEIFPDDPTKADFALFGLGVDEAANEEKTTV